MKKIAFIGAYDKTDFLLYVSKIMSVAEKKILLVDATIMQKAKYIVPVIHPTKTYITEFEGIDVAVGFTDMDEIRGYLGLASEDELDYDYAIIDVDTYDAYVNFGCQAAIKNYFVTSFDVYSLKKGIEALSGMEQTITLTKVLFSRDTSVEEDEYLEFLAMGSNVEWEKEKIYFPTDRGDQQIIIQNQRTSRINFKNLSTYYKGGLQYLVEGIFEQEGLNMGDVAKVIRRIEKGA